MFGPHTPKGECGQAFSPTTTAGGSRGAATIVRAPPGGSLRKAPPKGFFYEKCLAKYCNFIINLDHSLCHRSDGRSYIYLRVLFPRRQPSIIYEGIVLWLCIISKRRDCERAKRKLQRICYRLYPFSLLDEIRKDWQIVDVAQIGWTTYIFVSILFVFFCILFPHLFYCSPILFLTVSKTSPE